jgi:hypothetical protein
MNLLEDIINSIIKEELEVLDEAAKTLKDISSMALSTSSVDNGKIFVLYDPTLVIDILKLGIEGNPDLTKATIAVCYIEKNPCGFWEVKNSAARKKYGPILYDIVMSEIHPAYLASDRKWTSSAARKIWNYLFTYRANEMKMFPIDSERKECMHSGKGISIYSKSDKENDPALDYIFAIKNKIDTSKLKTINSALLSYAKKKFHFEESVLTNLINEGGGELFNVLFKSE